MNIILFNTAEIEGNDSPYTIKLSLQDKRGQHIIKVLHKKEGDKFLAGVINTSKGECQIVKIEKKAMTLIYLVRQVVEKDFIGEGEGKEREEKKESFIYPSKFLKIVLGLVRPIQLKRVLKDCATMGVSDISLVKTELGESSYAESSLLTPLKIEEYLVEGAMQGGRVYLPKVRVYGGLEEYISKNSINSINEGKNSIRGIKIALDNKKELEHFDCYIERIKKDAHSVTLFIGSERGWSENEREVFRKSKIKSCTLGKSILRSETCLTVAAGGVLMKFGLL